MATKQEIIDAAPILFEYVRDRKTRRKIGVIIAIGPNKVGWSICKKQHRKLISRAVILDADDERIRHVSETWKEIPGDIFDPDEAFARAFKKANLDEKYRVKIPCSIHSKYAEMMERSRRYFKQEA